MHAYKREKISLETQLNDIRKRSLQHDDHLRVVDAWWSQVSQTRVLSVLNETNTPKQLLDEVTLLSNHGLPTPVKKEGNTSPDQQMHLANIAIQYPFVHALRTVPNFPRI